MKQLGEFCLLILGSLLAASAMAQGELSADILQEAQAGQAQAQYEVALHYDAVQADYPAAVSWYQRAAEQGHVQAQFNLAQFYRLGEGVEQNSELALSWLLQAAEVGNDPQAQFMLGDIYRYGEGVVANRFEAFRWYILAAEQTLPEAEYIIGLWLAEGIGAPEDDAAALRWLRKAAAQGHAGGMFALAGMYENAQGIAPDLALAYYWYALAAQGDYPQAGAELDRLAGLLDAQTLQLQQQRVADCINTGFQAC